MVSNMAEKWARRFVWAAVFHGIIAVILTVLFLIPALNLASMIAVGFVSDSLTFKVGIWVFVGYVTYIIIGFVGLSAWSSLYSSSGEVNDWLSWVHLILHNIGIIASWLIFAAGAIGGTAQFGGALTVPEIHATIAWVFVPIVVLMGMLALGTLVGLVNIIIALLKER